MRPSIEMEGGTMVRSSTLRLPTELITA